MIRSQVIGRGYLTKELPPVFSSTALDASVALEGPLALEDSPRPGRGLNARPASHNLARPGNLRRRLQIPNPFSYYELATALEDNWKAIQSQLDRSYLSESRPAEDPNGLRASDATTERDDELAAMRQENEALRAELPASLTSTKADEGEVRP